MKFYNLKQVSEILLTPIPYLRTLINTDRKYKEILREELKRFVSSLGVKNER